MRGSSLILGVLLALCGCDRQPDAAPTGDTAVKRFSDPLVLAERRAIGRWRTDPGVLPGDKSIWVILDISGTHDVRAEIRGMSSRREAVYAMSDGRVEITQSGVTGTLTRPPSSLWVLKGFKAVFPNTSTMLVTSDDGRQFTFRYSGV